MNPTFGHFRNVVSLAWSTRRGAIERAVCADIEAGKPAGLQALLARCARRAGGCSYYVAQTVTAAAVAVGAGVAAWLLAGDPEAGLATQAAVGALGVAAAVGAYHAVVRRPGPSFIDAARLTQAQKNLDDSGDIHVRSPSVLTHAVMAAMYVADGCFAGFTLATAAFGSIFTAKMITAAGVAFSCACAWLLFHLAKEAAYEAAVNARRAMVRNLLSSPSEDEKRRGQAMLAQVGQALGYDLQRGADRVRARIVLALVVLGLSAATFVVRVSAENEDAPVATAPAADSQQP